MNTVRKRPPQFELQAGVLCLDFVNTLDDRPSEEPRELLTSYADLVRFAEDTGVVSPEVAGELVSNGNDDPNSAEQALREARALREAIHDVVWARIKKHPAPPSSFAELNRHLQEMLRHLRLVPGGRHFEWQFEESSTLESILWPIARSAADLLASDQVQFIRACSSKSCQWLFLDTSKNHRRRWCSMQVCGNRTKVRRFYARQRRQ